MHYTQEELKNLTFYQNLIDEDEQQYLQNKASLELRAGISGSDNQGNTVDYKPLPMTPELFSRRHDNLVYAMITAEDVEMRWIYYYKLILVVHKVYFLIFLCVF